MKLAKWWEPIKNNRVLCTLCPRLCKIGDGQSGFCFVRKNEGGELVQTAYGRAAGFAVDPVEKKPLNHFLPGTPTLSFGTAGCNLGCRFCQNWDMSKAKLDNLHSRQVTPQEVVQLAKKQKCPSIAYTYNDPTIFAEFVIDVARAARKEGIRNVMVTNGYIMPEARKEVYSYIDATNIDLKAFSETFYHKLTFSHLDDVLDTINWLVNETNVWVEITNLIIPGHNDDMGEIGEMVDWITDHLGDEVPLHFTAFHPDFKMLDTPAAPKSTLTKTRYLAMERGLKYVYVGNVFDSEGQTTFCPNCHKPLIERSWHSILEVNLDGTHCSCGQEIPVIWK
ncbi:MAG: AmmeMemoRadiSam system radical SAM enzyme [Candidatus Marinimicrobia bacterium]|jgi:pyruvate formate lyase activating enzyme|nr:AmmeMemoRadiSam system radical SAM enzyme [Candidatus Neomarinimicrobiota bacterium]MDP6592805.1 AmmeMemoRadiSam system radical SAM enzyme [Candidatus Neomarinimicrobiota bacterium]MDP6837191.1 AmmeMemoRadiSam system radical SAM enzyme [Candidatus Neomarinimicrobiota bacterium]MDP6965895.1 AmmeMemoRadiSam system radical SAM enzyme [Candidatus Neomarinimicrobiota bacterium]|tara:strand:+ start:3064 stop:4071 length:1008 start_codon:yes stop_codon:yes gene_type:complete